MSSYQFTFHRFLRLLIETNRFLQMHFNLNFSWSILNLGHFTISSSTRFPRVPSVLLQLCKPCLHCKPTGVVLARFFCQHGWHCRLSVTSARFLSYPCSNINTTSATDFSVTDISFWAASSWFPQSVSIKSSNVLCIPVTNCILRDRRESIFSEKSGCWICL